MLSPFPKSHPDNIVYYVPFLSYVFTMRKTDANGKPLIRKHPVNGTDMYTPEGNPEYIDEVLHFVPWLTRFTEDGYWSVYEVTAQTDPRIAAELAADAASPKSLIMSEEAFIKRINPDLFANMKAEEQRKKEVGALRDALKQAQDREQQQDSEISKLRAKLKG
jgi:hypothetical protein